jgi:hypothetical protein
MDGGADPGCIPGDKDLVEVVNRTRRGELKRSLPKSAKFWADHEEFERNRNQKQKAEIRIQTGRRPLSSVLPPPAGNLLLGVARRSRRSRD